MSTPDETSEDAARALAEEMRDMADTREERSEDG